MAVRREKTFHLSAPAQIVWQAAVNTFMAFGGQVQQADPYSLTITVQTGTTWASFGEIMRVWCVQMSGATQVTVTSESAVGTTLLDWGKNDQNIQTFEMAMYQQFPAAMGYPPPLPAEQPPQQPVYTPQEQLQPEPEQPDEQEFSFDGWMPQPDADDVRAPDIYDEKTQQAVKQFQAFREQRAREAEQEGKPLIFISYRRQDSADVTGRIYDRLIAVFGREALFKDVDNIPLGVNFKTYLEDTVNKCTHLLAIIGRQWTDIVGDDGKRRLENPADFVRIEIEAALSRGIPVIPLLVQGATMPKVEELPDTLRELHFRNGTPIRSDPDFHTDMDRLIKGLGG